MIDYCLYSFQNIYPLQTQEAEIKRKIKCKYEGHAIRFFLKKTTTFKELIATVEGEWGEGKGVMYKDEDGDWVKIRTNDDVVEMWDLGVVSLEVFSAQPNEVFFFFYVF